MNFKKKWERVCIIINKLSFSPHLSFLKLPGNIEQCPIHLVTMEREKNVKKYCSSDRNEIILQLKVECTGRCLYHLNITYFRSTQTDWPPRAYDMKDLPKIQMAMPMLNHSTYPK